MSTNTTPTCPDNCTFTLPENTFDFCRSDIHNGEIEIVYLAAPQAECFTDWTSLVEWTARLSSTSLDPNAIRRFRVIGTLPPASQEATDISLGQKYYGEKEFTVNLALEDLSDENYVFAQNLECNTTVKMWWQTAGGDLYGGMCGVDVNISSNLEITEGQNSINKLQWVATWKNKFTPDRITSPLA